MLVASQNSKFLVTTLLSPPPSSVLANTSTAILYLYLNTFSRDVPLSAHALTLTQFNSTYTQCSHQGYTPTNVTFNGHSLSRKLMHAYIQHSPTHGTMLCVKRQDPDGSHLVCADGLLWWLRTGYAHTHTQMATHWEWPGDGRADYWFAQINDSQPGHLTMGKLHPQSWHRGLAHRAHITAFMQGTSQVSFNPNSLLPEYIFKSLQICSNPWTNGFE